ncbi:hypothetical protein MKD41_05465 [Lutibacter sp. A64]|uniref:hypothetical protein n=1 Tax=Lutibacter sp. A64 TaxID=2918526 RepID=UPI001F06FBAE|nr:hypothetical protein [Lutibacter sp. A64]UMB54921.1 hypothetical protein MKD41_05465 [Lutibacter sp. A64]
MKKIIFTLVFCGLCFIVNSQTVSVEKSIYGIQSGFLGIWGHNESKLSNNIALRTELGLDAGIWGGDFYDNNGFLMIPVLTLEPRLYYNLKKRVKKSRKIAGNSGNFISLKTSYHPSWFEISNYNNIKIVSDISVVPTWGIRRNIGNHFLYETGIGIGYIYYFAKNAGFLENEGEVAVNLHVRIGYRF